ncbi:LysR family transcriptional regulator [Chelativorans sp.]|uniref:LysR family transcriptional regulator n=1 Tax=Chelativorans sp. TaxID=2203393 RepID=UPI00281158E0|nr:LysR family transcriptional regulator [Chelativorans sp.]
MRWSVQLATLHYAIVVAEEGSFLRASQRLAIDNTALSRRIRDLEYAIGVTLFHRHERGVRPTMAGARILERLRRILCDLDTALAAPTRGAQEVQQHLSVGVQRTLLHGRILDLFVGYARRLQDVRLILHEGPASELTTALAEKTLDIAVVPTTRFWAGEYELPLWRDELAVILPQSHVLAAQPNVAWRELEGEKVLACQGEEFLHVDLAGSSGIFPTVVEHQVGMAPLLRLVRDGLGVTLLQAGDALDVPEGTVCRKLRVQGKPVRISTVARWRHDNTNPALANFVGFIRTVGAMKAAGSASPS